MVANDKASVIACAIIAGVAVVLRLISRRRARLRLGGDDLFSVLASLALFGLMASALWGYDKGGWAYSPYQLSLPQLKVFLTALYIASLMSVLSLGFAKLSIVCLLYRIFGVNRRFRIMLHILTAYIVLHWIAAFLVFLVQCIPVNAAWDPVVKAAGARCVNTSSSALVLGILDALSEFLLCVLPINVVSKLKLPLRQRIGVSFVFTLGFFTASLAIVRVVTSYSPTSDDVNLHNQALWVDCQACVAIVAGCLPTYRKLLPEHLGFVSEFFRKRFYSFSSPGRATTARKIIISKPDPSKNDFRTQSKDSLSLQSSSDRPSVNPYLYELDPRRGEIVSEVSAANIDDSNHLPEIREENEVLPNRIQIDRSFSVA